MGHPGLVVWGWWFGRADDMAERVASNGLTMRWLGVRGVLGGGGFAKGGGGVMGDWKSPAGSVVRVYGCGVETCLKLVRLEASAPVITDTKNPDASLRSRSLCGLVIGTGFRATDADHLEDGHLYDPKSGRTYRGTIVAEGDSLKLHGYIGVSLFGRTEVWSRVGAVEACR
jgi:uncharacterized protein (DUF2147 family)